MTKTCMFDRRLQCNGSMCPIWSGDPNDGCCSILAIATQLSVIAAFLQMMMGIYKSTFEDAQGKPQVKRKEKS